MLILSALSGGMLVLCFPPFSLWPLAWVALVPWLFALRLSSPGRAALASWLMGLIFFGGLMSWIGLFGKSLWILLAATEALSFLWCGLLLRPVLRLRGFSGLLGAAAVWTSVEWLRGQTAFGLSWGWLGYSQADFLALAQMASWTSVLGVSFVIVFLNAAIADFLWEWRVGGRRAVAFRFSGVRVVLIGLGVLGLLRPLGALSRDRVVAASRGEFPVAVLQGSVHKRLTLGDVNRPRGFEEEEQELGIYEELTMRAARRLPRGKLAPKPLVELVIWPESAIPAALGRDSRAEERVGRIAAEAGCWLLAGGPYFDEAGRLFNSAFLFSPEGKLAGRYDKVRPVPFGEFVPGRSWLPFLNYYTIREIDIQAARRPILLQAGPARIGVSICFESTFPEIAAAERARGANLLAFITNDGWLDETAGPEQHAKMAVFRAIENRCWVLRAASSGISQVINPAGEVELEAGLYARKLLPVSISLASPPSARPLLVLWVPRGICLLALICIALGLPGKRAPLRRE